MSEVTQMLHAISAGDAVSSESLLPLVYDELRRQAARELARERPGQTLQATALVHEAWLRLSGAEDPGWKGRAHFFGAAAEAMRRILVDQARRKRSEKRGGGAERVDLERIEVATEADDEGLILVHEALERLEAHDPQAAALTKLRFFAGLEQREAASLLGLPERTAGRLWTYARSWLFREIQQNRTA
ncbi:MAG: sigma-70 family RNA polymerase sigma factor [Verrucomicrobiae bacterium]|nr:sigma-70 family RNA polymerase sigma factor [Verrucomicrobiae bacterium]